MRASNLTGALWAHFRGVSGTGAPGAAPRRESAREETSDFRRGVLGNAAVGIQESAGAPGRFDKIPSSAREGAISGSPSRPSLALRNAAKGVAKGPKSVALERLWELCGEFEGMFLAQIMRVMQHSVLKSGFLHGGVVEDIFTDQFCMAVGKQAGKRASLGLAKMLYERLARVVEAEADAEADVPGVREVLHRYAGGTQRDHMGTQLEQGPRRNSGGTFEVREGALGVGGRDISGASSVGHTKKGVRATRSSGG